MREAGRGMRTTDRGGRFIIIGENIHATRVVLRKGSHIAVAPDGRDAVRFSDAGGGERLFALPKAILTSDEFGLGKVKHVKAAIIAAMSGEGSGSDLDAADGRAYIAHLVRRQVDAGADFLDLNVDELSPDVEVQKDAMRWLVREVESVAGSVPVALDSSSAEVIRAGLETSSRPAGAPLLNSASLERLDVLDLAAEHGASIVITAAGRSGMPANAQDRIANATEMVEAATARGIPFGRLHVDPLVLPVAVDPDHGNHYLDAVRRLRETLGPAIHLTGGLSNVSFGLPVRRLLNDVFIDLAVEAGADSGIIDPVANDLARVFAQDRGSRARQLAADLLLGRDPFGGAFLAAYRRGELGGATVGG